MYNLIHENNQKSSTEYYIVNCASTGKSMYITLAKDGSRGYSNEDEIEYWNNVADTFPTLLHLIRKNRKSWEGTGKLSKVGSFNTIEEALNFIDVLLLVGG